MRDQERSVLEKYFSIFTRCSQTLFLHLHGTYSNERHGVTLVYLLGRLGHRLFTFLSYMCVVTRSAAHLCAWSIFMLITFIFSYWESFLVLF